MAESDPSERTFPATALQLERARQRGQIARSGDLSVPLGLMVAAGALWWAGPAILSACREMLSACLDSADQAGAVGAGPFVRLALLTGLVCLAAGLGAVVAQWIQVGWVFNAAPAAVDWQRVGWGANLRRVWSRRGVVRLAFAAAKLAVVGIVLRQRLGGWLVEFGRPEASLAQLGESMGSELLGLCVWLACLLGVLGLADWAYQRWEHRQDLRMSRRDWLDDMARMSRRAGRPESRQEAVADACHSASDNLQGVLTLLHRHRGLVLPVCAAGLVLAIFVPLPPGLVDVLLAANITLSAMILLTSIRVRSPMEFSVMPSVLLVATLFRLVMNVATTRLILTSGANGQDIQAAQLAAGRVVWTFARFVTADSLTVGVILFAVLVVVQFVVITKGAGRISEVAARFVLDAMPGKQAAIDADVAGKLIDQVQARARRNRIAAEADFYGAMDGASKFIRGDAIASALITGVNILGGMYVGVVQYGWGWSQSADLFTRLTIGDGLAAQVPALLTSISAAMLVSRSTAKSDLGEEMVGQLTAHPAVLGVTAAFLER